MPTRDPVDVSFVTSGHDVADARLHREVAALLARGMSVEVLGLGDEADGPPGAIVRTWPRRPAARRAGLAAELAARARGRVLVTLDPDSALAAGAVVVASGRVLVVDVHEDFAALLDDRPWASGNRGLNGRIAKGLVAAFTKAASAAALTVVADEHVPPLTARNRIVLPNVPYPGMLPGPTERDERPRALYVGDVRDTRGLFAMLEAVRLAPAWTLDVVGPLAPADEEQLALVLDGHIRDAGAAAGDLTSRVRLLGRRPPAAAWERARGAWCGMLLLADTPAFREAMPSKLYEYLACGLPVVTTDLPRQAAVVREHHAGEVVPCGPTDQVGPAVARILRGWSDRPDTLDEARRAAVAASAALAGAGPQRSPYDEFADAVAGLL